MKVVLPYVVDLREADVRMLRLLDFLGMHYETVCLAPGEPATERFAEVARNEPSTLILNFQSIKAWLAADLRRSVIPAVCSYFPRILAHGVSVGSEDDAVLAAISENQIEAAHPVGQALNTYDIESGSEDICGPYARLSIGPVQAPNNRVFLLNQRGRPIRSLISIGGRPFMAAVSTTKSELVLVGSEDVVDLDSEVNWPNPLDIPGAVAQSFSCFIPYVMALRHVAGEACWRPGNPYASILIDDPLLRERYGFLNYTWLSQRVNDLAFHAVTAFIPHNFRRTSPRVVRMFQTDPAHLSLCFHGNDHTGGEFATTNVALLNKMLHVAEHRIDSLRRRTGLDCGRVMVFPQGQFSAESMHALKSHNFHAAVNTVPFAVGQKARLTIRDLAQPAVLRYAGFPLFLRTPIRKISAHDIAFSLFFGRPILIGMHQNDFQRAGDLIEVVSLVKLMAPNAQWANLTTIVANSCLTRRAVDGTFHVRAYSPIVQICNRSDTWGKYQLEWTAERDDSLFDEILRDGKPCSAVTLSSAGLRLSAELAPRGACAFTVSHRSSQPILQSLGIRWKTRACIRRRLSEFRDNYLSRNPQLLQTAKAIRSCLNRAADGAG